MRSLVLVTISALVPVLGAGCAEELPDDIKGYEERCLKMNSAPIPPARDDPHEGIKDVYACGVTPEDLIDDEGRPLVPYPNGMVVVKDSRRGWVSDGEIVIDQDFPWLIATARKIDGIWRWAEYTRNFENEALRKILGSASICVDCHRKASRSDFIFTVFQP